VQVSSSTVSLTVDDVELSRAFFVDHLGYNEKMSADGFVSLGREDAATNLVFLRRGLEVLPAGFRDEHAAGVIVALVVSDLEGELARLSGEGVAITLPLREEAWGERLFQVTDPNGVVVELVEWV
jgi:catechol 2,3-dioxygenase-like lactoylglutathione lyase family enzyme